MFVAAVSLALYEDLCFSTARFLMFFLFFLFLCTEEEEEEEDKIFTSDAIH